MHEAVVSTFETKTYNLNQINEVATDLLQAGFPGVWCFFGEMGSGKTTLIKALCQRLGVASTTGSPTFSIINEYNFLSAGKVAHFDFYRLKNEMEAYDLGVDEYFASGFYCFVEWPERVLSLIPDRHIEIRLSVEDPISRKIEFKKHE